MKISKLVIVAVMALFANTVFAQKFAHISRDELIQAMPEVKTAQASLESYGKELQSSIEEVRVAFNKAYQDLQQNEATLSEDAKKTKYDELQKMSTRLEEQNQKAQEDFQKKQEELFAPIMKKASDAISAVGKRGGYIYVFDTSIFHYVDESQSTNIINDVKKELGI